MHTTNYANAFIAIADDCKADSGGVPPGQPCPRSSPLPKSYGWGIHFDAKARAAIDAVDSREYA